MSITIGFGWWLVPTAITIIAFAWARIIELRQRRSGNGYFGGLGDALVATFLYGPAIIVSMVVWLAWAVAT